MSDDADGGSTARKLFTSSGIVFVGIALQLGLGFVARVVIARLLGRVDYGAVALGLTLLTSVSILVLVGTDTGVGRFLPRHDDPARRRGVLASAFRVVVPLSIVVGVGLVLLADPLASEVFDDPDTAPVIRAFGFAVPFASLVRLAVGGARGMEQSLPKVYLQNIALPVVRLGFVVAALLLGFRATGVAWAYAAAYAVTGTLALVYLLRYTPLFDDGPVESMYRPLLAFSVPLMVTATMNMVFQNIDTLMLGMFATTGDVGVYNVVYPLAQLLTVALTAFGFLFMPVISKLHADGESAEMERTYQVVSKWILFATLPLFLVLAFDPRAVIGLTFGSEYTSGGLVLTVLAAGFVTHAITGPSGNVLTALGRSRTIMYDNSLVAGVNVALNLYLIPRYPLLGAAVATTVGYALMNGLYLLQLHRSTGMHPFRRALVAPSVAAVVLWVGLHAAAGAVLPDGPVSLAARLGVFLALYPLVVLRFGGVESEDVSLVTAFEDRVGVDLAPVRSVAGRIAN